MVGLRLASRSVSTVSPGTFGGTTRGGSVKLAGPCHTAFGLFQQSRRLGRQAGVGVQDLHPRRIAAPIASMWFLIGEPSQTAQMTPIGAGQVAAIGVSQLLADEAGDDRLDRGDADLHPGLQIAGAGLEHHTRFVPVAPHGFEE